VLDTRQRASSLESQTTSAVNAFEETGIASWYGPGFHGRETANGEVFDQEQLTAAHPTLPLPSFVEVTNLQNGRQVVVRVNDRGPFVAGRIIDVSAAAANQLGMRELGQAEVRVRYMAPAPALTATTATAVNSVPTPAAVEMPSGPRRLAPAPLVTPVTAAPALPVPTIRNASLLTMPVVPDVRPAPRTPETRSMASDSGWSNASGQSGFVVQAGSFVEIENANRLRDRIKSTGQIVGVQMASVRGSQVFRVVVGPWATKADAEAAKERLADKGFGEGLVRSNL
jgi:rare lipoprotein A